VAISRKQFIDQYLEELLDNTQTIEQSIIVLKRDPKNDDNLAKILRALHSIKGSSRMLKFSEMEKITHGLENVFKGIKDQRYTVDKMIVQLVFITIDYLRFGADTIRENQEDNFNTVQLLKVFDKVFAAEPYTFTAVLDEKAGFQPVEHDEDTQTVSSQETVAKSPVKTGLQEQPPIMGKTSLSGSSTIRINTDVVSEIVRKLNDLIIKQMQFKKNYDEFDKIGDELHSLFTFLKNVTGGSSSFELSKIERSVVQKIRRLKKSYIDGQELVEEDTFKIQEEIINLGMLPVTMIFGSLERMVEETASNLNKEIQLKSTGMDVHLDKMVLERVQDPVIHLIRNAVDHGIESPDVREQKGKNRIGEILLSCSSERGKIFISIKDDGKGLDYENIRKKAAKLYPDMESDIKNMAESELNTFLFAPGFSTKSSASELSGRGVGLDIVKHNVEKIKGKIDVVSTRDAGTEFVLTLPLSLATSNGYFISCSNQKLFLPSEFVENILILDSSDVIHLANQTGFKYKGRIIPLYDLATLLKKETFRDKEYNVVIIKSFDDTVGMIVDSILEHSSLIFKSLPPLIADLDAVQGVVFDEYFDMICILHIPVIIDMFKSLRSIDRKITYTSSTKSMERILVVDDSVNAREIEKSILEKEGYLVDTAVDGIDALENIRTNNYGLIISDLEMPRMNGFTLIENIRNNEKVKDLPEIPIIVVSTYKDRGIMEKVKELGVESYIIKSSFERGDLLAEVNRQLEKNG
jgi:two-component system chemotaxis sensor kinase CheA